jgi:hypothetical protein
MATLQAIQGLVNEAKEKIADPNVDLEAFRKYVRTILWPEIKSRLGQCTDLQWIYREDMSLLIYKWLNELSLNAMPVRLDLELLKGGLIAETAKVPAKPDDVIVWLPW